ncbi:MAG: hypothetical protein U0744_16010 [Gemmataceae bacterium]
MRTIAIALLTAGLFGCVTIPDGVLPKAPPAASEGKTAGPTRRWSAEEVNDRNARKISMELWDDLDREESEPRQSNTK